MLAHASNTGGVDLLPLTCRGRTEDAGLMPWLAWHVADMLQGGHGWRGSRYLLHAVCLLAGPSGMQPSGMLPCYHCSFVGRCT
jgi:hypothetical protein